MQNNFSVIVLAAGEGKRMKSERSKMLHEIAGRPMLARTIEILRKVSPQEIIVVANPKNQNEIKKFASGAKIVIQQKPLGTADAASVGLKSVSKNVETVAVMYGDDTAFYKPETIKKVFILHQKAVPKITFVTVIKKNPFGLGRIVRKNGKLSAIIEEKDATEEQKKVKEINDGLYFFEKAWIKDNIERLKPSPYTGELYVTDLIEIALEDGQKVETYRLPDDSQWHGINTPEELEEASRKLSKKIHIMGIGGAGASGVAGIAKAYGFQVSGCDISKTSAYLADFKIEKSHDPKHLEGVDQLIISPAILKNDPQNKEIAWAKKHNIPVLTWQEFQGRVLNKGKFVIAVAGAYGKSTTTGMISQILVDANLNPTCEIGAKVLSWGKNFRVGKSKYFVCEADEYNNNFLNYEPDIAVILNVGWDHPDFFNSKDQVFASFENFIDGIKKNGTLVIAQNADLEKVSRTARSDIKIVRVGDFGKLDLKIIGDFRAQNANAALTVAKVLGIDEKVAKKSVQNFQGTGRRLEYKGQIGKVKVYDDYGVQPFTIKTTADALKSKFKNKKVVLVLEPHTFTRINTFFEDFVESLQDTKVDRILVTDVFAAREKGNKVELSKKLAKVIGQKAKYSGSLEDTADYLKENLTDFDIILSMGAGDSYKLWELMKK